LKSSEIIIIILKLLNIFALESHVVGAIINVAQKVNNPWPLEILDHRNKHYQVELKPGDVLWYEASK
jgi:hypothetical protein